MPSTVIRTFRYEPGTNRLVIDFQSGRRYVYFDVPFDVYESMRAARSRGSYFNTWVRDRYSYSRLDDASDEETGARGSTSTAGRRLLELLRPLRSGQH